MKKWSKRMAPVLILAWALIFCSLSVSAGEEKGVPGNEDAEELFGAFVPEEEVSSEPAALRGSGNIADQGTAGRLSWKIEYSDVYDGVLYIEGSGPMEDYLYDCRKAPWANSKMLYLVKRIEIGSGITHIGNYAFRFPNSAALCMPESIYIANTVTSIGTSAFSASECLREVNIPSSVKSIGDGAFYYCRRLERLTLNNGLETIGDRAFKDCYSLTEISLPSTVRTLGADAFESCGTCRVVVPPSVTSIGEHALGYNSNKAIVDFIIQGTAGSQAEIYARQNSFLFTTTSGPVLKPEVTAADIRANTAEIKWNAISGAAKYEVFYREGKPASGAWKSIGTTSGTSYIWSQAVTGQYCSFAVRAFDYAGSPITGYGSCDPIFMRSAAPEFTVSQTKYGIKIAWPDAPYSYSYRVLYRTGSGEFRTLADVRDTSFNWSGAKPGSSYWFSVCMLNVDGSVISYYDPAGKKITMAYTLGTPQMSGVQNVNGGMKITWKRVSGAEKYRVYYKTGSSGWKKLADTSALSYIWKGAKSGTKYAFTVCCTDRNGKELSAYSAAGKSLLYLAAPALSSAKKTSAGIRVSWKKTAGAKGYYVFRKTAGAGWTKIGTTASLTYTDKKARKGTTYTYTVRAYKGAVKSGFRQKGVSQKR